jgi:hypothetical protein
MEKDFKYLSYRNTNLFLKQSDEGELLRFGSFHELDLIIQNYNKRKQN